MVHDDTQAKTADVLNVLVGLWLIISPFVMGGVLAQMGTQFTVVGLFVGVLSILNYFRPHDTWMSWVNLLAGLWLVVSPFVMGYTSTTLLMYSIVPGIIVLILSFWETRAVEGHSHRTTA
jgi:hypothetical protein